MCRQQATLDSNLQREIDTVTDINFQDWVAGLNLSSRFDHYLEFKPAQNAETYQTANVT